MDFENRVYQSFSDTGHLRLSQHYVIWNIMSQNTIMKTSGWNQQHNLVDRYQCFKWTCYLSHPDRSAGWGSTFLQITSICLLPNCTVLVKWNTNLMQHCAGFISAESLYMFQAQAPIIRSFKTSTAATGTCVIIVGQSSHLLIRAERP